MEGKKRDGWSSRSAFILAAVGSAVGLGNAWRFPGLVAKHGGGTFLVVYLIAMLVIGVPLLMMEISIGRKTRCGAPGAMASMNKKFEFIGWAATANAFVITSYYAMVFAWVLAMTFFSYKFAGMVHDVDAASNLFATMTQTSWTVSGYDIPMAMLVALIVAWGLIYVCIKDGAKSVSKIVKLTVFMPVFCLLIMAVKGVSMPGGMQGVIKLFTPDLAGFTNISLWIDAVGQVFYSLSIMMAIMFAYGSFLDRDTNIAVDAIIIAFSDMAISVLAGIVMFSTMGGVGMLENMSDSGIVTAFIVYPQAIVNLTSSGWVNAFFGFVFYLCLVTLAIDSAFSIVEGVSTAIADKFHLSHKTVVRNVCIVSAIVSLVYATRAGLAWLDIVDNWTNQYNMIFIGIAECIAVGWLFDVRKVLDEINLNTKKFKMPGWWFMTSIKVISPVLLTILVSLKLYILFSVDNGLYGGYPMWSIMIGGWTVTLLSFISGWIVKWVVKRMNKKGYVENYTAWDDIK